MNIKPKIGIVGIGMVGGVLKRYFEEKGFKRGKNLFCFDTDPSKKCTDDPKEAEVLFICVPTPSKKDGSCHTGIIEDVVKKYTDSAKVIVIKSTIEPGATERLAKKHKCALIFSPEFLTEAKSWENMINPDRQIIAPTAKAKAATSHVLHLLPHAQFTAPRHKKAVRWTKMNPTEAEIGKYAANTFGALKVSFANFFHDFTRMMERSLNKEGIKIKLNYKNVRHVLAEDPRIGGSWLDVVHGNYRGYGGYCFPKDTEALIACGRRMLKKTPQDPNKNLLRKGLKIFESMKDYNDAVLASQGLTSKNVSKHDAELLQIIKKHKKRKRAQN